MKFSSSKDRYWDKAIHTVKNLSRFNMSRYLPLTKFCFRTLSKGEIQSCQRRRGIGSVASMVGRPEETLSGLDKESLLFPSSVLLVKRFS